MSGSDAEDYRELGEHHCRESHCPGYINISLHSYHIGCKSGETYYQ